MTEETGRRHHFQTLIVGHFDGTLSTEQEQELAAALRESEEAKDLFCAFMRMEGRLHSLGRDGFLSGSVARSEVHMAEAAPSSGPNTGFAGRQGGRLRLVAASTSLLACAAVLLMLASNVFWPTSVSASSVLKKAQRAAAELIDRTYRINLNQGGSKSRSRELTVDVRGGGRFLVRPDGGAYTMGSDGKQYWLVGKTGPVWVTDNYRKLTPELRRKIPDRRLLEIASSPNEPLLLGITDLLSLIERHYDVELLSSARENEYHVRATRRSEKRNAPSVVEFWADSATGTVLRGKSTWPDGRTTRFEFVGSTARPDRWYDHSEHAAGREVKRMGAVDGP